VGVITRTEWFSQFTSRRFQRLGREFLWIGSGQAAATLGALVGVRLLTGMLSPELYGELALGMTLVILVSQVVLGPLGGAVLRFFAPASEAHEMANFLAALRRLLGKATGVVLLLAVATCLMLLLTGQSNWLWLGIAAFGFALVSGYNCTLDGMQNAMRQRPIVAWHQALASWARFLAAAMMVLWLGATSAVAMLGYVLAGLLVLYSQWWFFRRSVRPTTKLISNGARLPRRWETQMFAYAWPFAIWGTFTWAQMASDRWALQIFASIHEVGLYTVLYQLGYYPITLLTGLMVQLVAPVFFQRAGDASDPSRIRQVHDLNNWLTIVALLLTGIAALLAYTLHGRIFAWLVAPEYRAISWLLPGMVLAGGLFAAGQIAVIYLLSGTKTRSLIAPKIVTSVVGVLMNMVGAAWFGIWGVVVGSIITSGVYLIWILYLVRIRYNQSVNSAVADYQNPSTISKQIGYV
jgi:O-antigen/teichoic acid export membrane protein